MQRYYSVNQFYNEQNGEGTEEDIVSIEDTNTKILFNLCKIYYFIQFLFFGPDIVSMIYGNLFPISICFSMIYLISGMMYMDEYELKKSLILFTFMIAVFRTNFNSQVCPL